MVVSLTRCTMSVNEDRGSEPIDGGTNSESESQGTDGTNSESEPQDTDCANSESKCQDTESIRIPRIR